VISFRRRATAAIQGQPAAVARAFYGPHGMKAPRSARTESDGHDACQPMMPAMPFSIMADRLHRMETGALSGRTFGWSGFIYPSPAPVSVTRADETPQSTTDAATES